MNAFRKSLGMVTIAAMLASATTPAMARPDHGWGGHRHGGHGHGHGGGWHHGRGHGGDDDFGNFLLGAVVAGGIIAIASAASRQKKAVGLPEGDADGRDGRSGDGRRDWSDGQSTAASLCAEGVEGMVSRGADPARVDDIGHVASDGDDRYRVEGRLDNGKAFACGVSRGAVTYVEISDSTVALR